MRKILYAAVLLLISVRAFGQTQVAPVVVNGGGTTGPTTYCSVGTVATGTCPMPVTVTGGGGETVTANQGTPNAGGANAWPVVQASQPLPTGAATALLQSQPYSNAGVGTSTAVTIQGNPSGLAVPISGSVTTSGTVTTTPGQRTPVTLDVKTVTTGGTAVTAINSGNRTAGGFLCNPQGATVNMGINDIGTASGTTSSGDTSFITPGNCYNVAPAAGAVSVITADSNHPFSGEGYK